MSNSNSCFDMSGLTRIAVMKIEYAHFTNFGVSIQPSAADADGFIRYRDGYENLPVDSWTAGETWMNAQCARIDEWRCTDRRGEGR